MNETINSHPPPLAIFGIPVDNIDLQTAIDRCLRIVQRSDPKDLPFHVTSAELSLMTRCYGWWPTSVRDPNLLSIIRHANLSLAPYPLLRILMKCLGSTLVEPITANQLLLSLCLSLGKKEKSIFLLGDEDKTTKRVAIKLHDNSRGLRIVGIVSSAIFTEGEVLASSEERDTLLVEQINASRTDVLVINLESPKQELWLERVCHRLNVSMVFTLGNQLTRLAKDEASQQNYNFGDLIKTSSSILKFCCMAVPLLVYHTINQTLFRLFYKKGTSTQCPKNDQLFLSAHRSIAFISLPELIDASNINELKRRFDEAAHHDVVVFDFLAVRHIQPEGFHLLIEAWLQREEQQREIYGFCPTSDIKCLMKVHHTWDLFKDTVCDSAKTLMVRLTGRGELTAFYDTFMQQDDRVIISILGALDNRTDYDTYLRKLTPIIGTKECTIDLRYCTSIDNSGIAFLLTLRKQQQTRHRRLILTSLNRRLHRQLQEAKVDDLLKINGE